MKIRLSKSKYYPLYIYVLLLLFFGVAFTKTQIIGPLYLHDLLLIIFTIYSLLVKPLKSVRFPTILLTIILALFYLFYSLVFLGLSSELKIIALRQFMMFFYLIVAYIFYNQYIRDNDLQPLIVFFIRIGIISVLLQIIYFIYLLLFDYKNFDLFEGYNYYSHVIMFGFINFVSYSLVFVKGLIKWVVFLFVLILSTLLGHASLFLAVFVVILLYFLKKVNFKGKMIAIFMALLSISMLMLLPQFQDANASWRLMYWKEILGRVFIGNFGIIGEGFGIPYVSLDFAYELRDKLGAFGFLDKSRYLERWVSPPHNSFFTIAFHLGFVALVLLFLPLKKTVKYFFIDNDSRLDKNKVFLLLLLFGYMVWVSFNVILELPHSAMMFWIVFFVTIEYFNRSKKIEE